MNSLDIVHLHINQLGNPVEVCQGVFLKCMWGIFQSTRAMYLQLESKRREPMDGAMSTRLVTQARSSLRQRVSLYTRWQSLRGREIYTRSLNPDQMIKIILVFPSLVYSPKISRIMRSPMAGKKKNKTSFSKITNTYTTKLTTVKQSSTHHASRLKFKPIARPGRQ